MAVAVLVQRFIFRLDEGWDSALWEEELRDDFVLGTGRLPVRVVERF